MSSPPRVVLDTNAVLDWLVFRDPTMTAMGAAIEGGRVDWRASPAMRIELEQVLTRAALAQWEPDVSGIVRRWARHACLEPAEPPPCPLACRDPDDQVFINLALHRRCRWLLTRDRALLTLAKAARRHGVVILTPAAWSHSESLDTP